MSSNSRTRNQRVIRWACLADEGYLYEKIKQNLAKSGVLFYCLRQKGGGMFDVLSRGIVWYRWSIAVLWGLAAVALAMYMLYGANLYLAFCFGCVCTSGLAAVYGYTLRCQRREFVRETPGVCNQCGYEPQTGMKRCPECGGAVNRPTEDHS